MSEAHSHGDEGVGWTHASSAWVPVCPECRQSVFGIVSALEAERDELRAALWDLREYIYWPDRAAAYVGEDVLRSRIDALIGPVSPPDGRSGPEGG